MNNISKIVFRAYKERYNGLDTVEELEQAKRDFLISSELFGTYKSTVSRFIESKELEIKNKALDNLIKPFNQVEPLVFNIKGLDSLRYKINNIINNKLKYEFKGLFNLLSDKRNLVYNPLYIRQQIIRDLNLFKSLRFFNVGYISRHDLKNEYKYLSFKNDAEVGHSKVYFIKKGLYVMKTLKKDDITLKVFYVSKKYKTLVKKSNKVFCPLKEDKFNLSCIDAYKVLDKKDNMKYYSYCNRIGLDKKNRQLLKSIRMTKKPSKDSLIDYLEEREKEITEEMKISSELEVLYLEIELQEIKEKLQELKTLEEDNSFEDKTFLSDYF